MDGSDVTSEEEGEMEDAEERGSVDSSEGEEDDEDEVRLGFLITFEARLGFLITFENVVLTLLLKGGCFVSLYVRIPSFLNKF